MTGPELEFLAQRVAELVMERFRQADFIDQHNSPLGSRNHINAIRDGKLKGMQQGRRYVAAREDVVAYMRATSAPANKDPGRADDVDQIGAQLGLRRRG